MFLQRKINRAMKLQQEQREASRQEPLPEDKDELKLGFKDRLAMYFSAMLVIMPVAIIVLLALCFGCYFLFFH